MLRKLVASGMIAGIAAGLIATLLQLVFVVPLIVQAELYESGQLQHFAMAAPDHLSDAPSAVASAADAAHDHNDGLHTHETDPDTGFDLTRHGLTVIANIATYSGFALLLAAAFGLAEGWGVRLNARSGALWGAAGFIAVHLATGAGLPPELPGNFAADLQARQIWWLVTAALSFGGIMAIAYGRNAATLALGAAVIAIPHLVGAPHSPEFGGLVPPELMALFVTRSLAVAAIVWVVLGGLAGFVWARHETT
jgi:cobalt transporter subunit CbtA